VERDEIYAKAHSRRSGVIGVGSVRTDRRGASAPPDAKSSVEDLRKELMQLPYSGVFDFLAFGYDKVTLTLLGTLIIRT
jgi:hypothetical protein